MGRVICHENPLGVEVVYFWGRGKLQRQVYREVFLGKRCEQVGDEVGARCMEIREQLNPKRFAPAT